VDSRKDNVHQSIEIKRYLIILASLLGLSFCLYAKPIKRPLTLQELDLPLQVKKNLSKKIYSKASVKTNKKIQSLNLSVVGLHTKKCMTALSKISQFERYHEFISFIKVSQYVEPTKMIKLKVDHLLMPYTMVLKFQIDRPIKPGDYPFTFTQGFLKGLKGLIRIGKHEKRCLFSMQANWQGAETKISDRVFSFFLEFLGGKLMGTLFHISRTL
jgi:hypothetical protein